LFWQEVFMSLLLRVREADLRCTLFAFGISFHSRLRSRWARVFAIGSFGDTYVLLFFF